MQEAVVARDATVVRTGTVLGVAQPVDQRGEHRFGPGIALTHSVQTDAPRRGRRSYRAKTRIERVGDGPESLLHRITCFSRCAFDGPDLVAQRAFRGHDSTEAARWLKGHMTDIVSKVTAGRPQRRRTGSRLGIIEREVGSS